MVDKSQAPKDIFFCFNNNSYYILTSVNSDANILFTLNNHKKTLILLNKSSLEDHTSRQQHFLFKEKDEK